MPKSVVSSRTVCADATPRSSRSLAAVTSLTLLAASLGLALAPRSSADASDDLRSAVVQARAATSCGALKANPIVDQAAATINKSTQDYLNHAATQVPITDPLPGLKILGYPGGKAIALQGASMTRANSIKGLLLQGYDKIPNCSYTDFGVDARHHDATGYELTVVVLAGA
jgi:hypothetical protein